MHQNFKRPSRTRSDARRCGALLVAIASFASASWGRQTGEVYKSVDAQGHVVYSDQPDSSPAAQSPAGIEASEAIADAEVSATEAPPPLPDYEQPPNTEDGYLWTPGYWAWGAAGYYWVPGAWVQPPRVGVLWTPGYWVFVSTLYVFHPGYWARHIGYYGGVNYGFGYFGVGFAGGRWLGNSFAYNRTVSNVDARVIHNTYNESVPNNIIHNRASYNGGPGGTTSAPTAQERAFAAEPHIHPTSLQRQSMIQAARTPVLMPHMSVGSQPGPDADHSVATVQKPVVPHAPAVPGTHGGAAHPAASPHELAQAPPHSKVPQAEVPHPSTPTTASTPARAAPTKAQHPTHYPMH